VNSCPVIALCPFPSCNLRWCRPGNDRNLYSSCSIAMGMTLHKRLIDIRVGGGRENHFRKETEALNGVPGSAGGGGWLLWECIPTYYCPTGKGLSTVYNRGASNEGSTVRSLGCGFPLNSITVGSQACMFEFLGSFVN